MAGAAHDSPVRREALAEALESDFQPLLVCVLTLEQAASSELCCLAANSAACRWLGLPLDEVEGRPLAELPHDLLRGQLAHIVRAIEEREGLQFLQDGLVVQALPTLSTPRRTYASITVRHTAPLAHAAEDRQAARFLDSIIEHLPAMVFVKDAVHLRFERFNRAGEQLLGVGREQLLGKNDYDIFPREQADFFTAKDRQVLAGRVLLDIAQEPIETPRGTRWLHTLKLPVMDSSGAPAHLLGVSMDITAQKRAEELLLLSHDQLKQRIAERTLEVERQMDELKRAEDALARTEAELRQSQKMEAIGRLAGGIAHDFNNLLSVVLGYSELSLQRVESDDPLRSFLDQIQRAAIRATELTRQLLAFGRRQVLLPKTLDLNEVVEGLRTMLARLLGEDIKMVFERSEELGRVRADPSQIEQVLLNLVVNARDAMPAGGILTIATQDVDSAALPPDGQSVGLSGALVELRVTDTGIGMDQATLEHIFEPFFTTKDVGKGSGLGLSTAFGIVKQSDGVIRVSSRLGHGSSFYILLPRSQDAPSAAPAIAPHLREVGGTETILLVEDEDHVRAFVAECLRGLGYRVLEAEGPHPALQLAESLPGIDLLLTDVVMPDGGGRAVSEALTRKWPWLPVLFMSGYTDDAVIKRGVLEPGAAFLQKPLTRQQLAARVRELLDRAAGVAT